MKERTQTRLFKSAYLADSLASRRGLQHQVLYLLDAPACPAQSFGFRD